jgi:cystatin-A/B
MLGVFASLPENNQVPLLSLFISQEQALLDGVKAAVEGKVGKALAELKAINYRSQVVAGTNYLIEAQAGEEFYHVKIFKPLPHTGAPAEVNHVSGPHAAGTELSPP